MAVFQLYSPFYNYISLRTDAMGSQSGSLFIIYLSIYLIFSVEGNLQLFSKAIFHN